MGRSFTASSREELFGSKVETVEPCTFFKPLEFHGFNIRIITMCPYYGKFSGVL
jgi:hypothetical protein